LLQFDIGPLKVPNRGCEKLLGSFAQSDVPDGRSDQDAVGILERTQHDLNGKLASVFPPSIQLDLCTDMLYRCVSDVPFPLLDQQFREARGNDFLHLLSKKFVTTVSELFLRLHVQQNDLSALVHYHHRIRSRFQQPAKLLLTLAERLLGKPAREAFSMNTPHGGDNDEQAQGATQNQNCLGLAQALS